MTAAIDPNGNQTDYVYNPLGLEASVTAPSRVVVENQKTYSGRPQTFKSYDVAGNLTQVLQPSLASGENPHLTSYTVNALGQVLESRSVTAGPGSSPAGTDIVADYTYDPNGNRLTQTSGYAKDSRLGKSWSYDSHNRVISETDEEGMVTSYTYDLVGNRTGITDPRNGLSGYQGTFVLSLSYNQFNR